jgi:putative transposon-encoded protein
MKCTLTISDMEPLRVQDVMRKTASRTTVGTDRVYGRVYVPKEWIGKEVLVALIDDAPESDGEVS